MSHDLHVVEMGAGEPPLVLLHGYVGSHLDWADVQPVLARHRRVIAVDHRGHGESHNYGDPDAYTFDALVGDLLETFDRLGLEQADLLGHSMGGVVAQRFAIEQPHRLRSLILMDTAPDPAGDGLPMDIIEMMAGIGREQGMAAALTMAAEMAKAAAGTPERAPEREAVLAERGGVKFAQLDPEAFLGFGRALNTYPSMTAQLAGVQLPTSVIVGERDTGLFPSAELMAETIPDAVLRVITGAGHSPQEDEPEQWLAAVHAHLAMVEAR